MSEPNRQEPDVESAGIDVLRLLQVHGIPAMAAAVVVALLTAVGGWVYLKWFQETTQISVLEFRPTFSGAGKMEYPNGLPFSVNDITAGPILDQVFDQGDVAAFCDREHFRAGFFVERYSDQSHLLDLEYRRRLSEPRLDPGERRNLEEEYANKRAALPLQYRLVFMTPSSCLKMPRAAIAKSLEAVLATWASESEARRGVLRHQVEVLGPDVLDVRAGGSAASVVRADLVRTALDRLVDSVSAVGELPGAHLVRVGEARRTFLDVRTRLTDLIAARLDPLIMTAGRASSRDALAWVTETLAAAERRRQLAEDRAEVYRAALREFSRGTGDGVDRPDASGRAAQGNQAVAPQVDRSFIDRIVEMSSATEPYRRELTEELVKASLEAAEVQNSVVYYRRLLQALREPGGAALSQAEVDARLDEILAEGRALATEFGALYDEFARVSLRPAGAMYQTDKPVTTTIDRPFNRPDLIQLMAMAFIVTVLLVVGLGVARERMRVARP